MARRDSNPLYVLSLLPWRVSLIAAVSVFVLMRFVAPNFSAADNMLLHGLLNQTAPRLATFFVCLFLLLGVLSFFREQSRARLLASQTGIESIRKLDASSDHFGTTEISEYQKTAGLIDFLGARHLRIGRRVVWEIAEKVPGLFSEAENKPGTFAKNKPGTFSQCMDHSESRITD